MDRTQSGYLIIIASAFLLSTSYYVKSFQSLQDFQAYARVHSESQPIENTNWLSPDYSNYYQSSVPTFIDTILYKIGISKKQPFDVHWFAKKLKQIITYREALSLNNEHVMFMRCDVGNKIFVFGDVHGAFHSLVRDLTFLHSKYIIDEHLKITDKNYYLVFNGNVIDRSPFNLETLALILVLMEQNPKQVIYIRGKHEYKNYWHNFNLKQELIIRIPSNTSTAIPLGNEISTFFNTLPLALYLAVDTPVKDIIRISNFGWENSLINENYLGNLFLENIDKQIVSYNLQNHIKTTQEVNVKVFITKENWMTERRTSSGLGHMDQINGATTWAILSCPTDLYQKYFDLFFDAFIEIAIEKPIEKSIITLYHQDIRKSEGFKVGGIYNIYTGKIVNTEENASPIIINNDIEIGSSMALVGGVVSMGTGTKLGMSVRINQQNRTGGVDNHPIRTFILNDDYTPSIARKNILYLLNDKHINTILLPIGSPTISAYLDLIKNNTLLVLFPVTGGPQFRDPELKGLVHYRASYADEVEQLLHYEINVLGARKFAFFYQNDAYGLGPLQAAHETLKKYGITEWTDIPYTRAASSLEEQAQKVNAAQPDAIGLFSAGNQTAEFLRQLGMDSIANKKLFGISFLAEESFRVFIKQHGISIVFGAVVPNPKVSQLEIVKEYRAAMDAVNHNYDVYSLEGYIGASIFIEVLKNITSPFNKENILDKIQSLRDYKFKGLTLTFNPQKRDLSQPVWLETSEDKEWAAMKETLSK